MVFKKSQSLSKGFGNYLSSWIEFTIKLDQGLTLSNSTVQMCEFIWFIQLMTVLELHLQYASEQVGDNVENYLQLIISPLYTLGVYQVVILVIPLGVLTIVFVRLFVKTINLKDKIQSQEKSQLIQLLHHATCLINKLMASILYIPANYMLIRSFWIAVKQIADGDLTFLTHLIIIIVLQGLFLFYFVGRSFCLEQMLIKGDFNKLSVPLSVYLNYAIQFLLILSCGSLNHSDLNHIAVILLSFVYLSIYFWQTLFEQLHTEDSHKRLRLILVSCYTVYIMVGVIMFFEDQHSFPNGALLFLATPPLAKLLLHHYDMQLIDMVSQEKRQRSQYMQMLYATTLLNMHLHRHGNIVFRAIVIKSHQCKYPDEVCKQPTQSFDGIIMFKNQQLEEIILHNCYNMVLSAVDMKNFSMQFTYRILAVRSLCVIGRVNQAQMLVQMLLSTQKSSNSSTQDTRAQALLNQHWNTILYMRLPALSRLQQKQLKCIHNKLNGLLIQRMELSIPEQGSYESSSLRRGVSLFFESERHNKRIIKQVFSLLEDKLHFMIYMANQQNFNGNRACNILKRLSNRIMIIEEQFISLYQAFPSHRMQSIVLLLESEILNNYLKAWQLCSFATLEDDSVRKITDGIKIDLLRNNVTYLVSNLDGDHNRLLLDRISPSAIQYFGYSKQQLASLDIVERLMPNFVSGHHHQFVKRFLAEGHSKYFRLVSTTMIKDVHGHLQFVEMFFDVNQQGGGISFITFIQGIQNPPSCLLVTSNGSIDSASESLLNDISIITNISQSIISRSVINQNIDQLLSITREQLSSDQIDSLTGNYIWKIPVDSKFFSSSITSIEVQSFIEIEHRQIETLSYYLFKVTDIQPVAYQSQTSTIYQTQFDVPHESSDIGPLMIRLNSQPQPRNILSVGTPREITIISPFNHDIQLLATNQQYFLSFDDHPGNKMLPSQRSQIVSPRQPELDKETLQKPAVDSRFVEFTKEQAYMDRNKPEHYEQSISSSIGGIRKSEFFKKYDRITHFISDKSQHKMIHFLTYVHILKFSLCIIQASIVLAMIDKDVDEIRSEFETLQVNRLFIEPIDQYSLIRYAIVGYQASFKYGQISNESYNSYLSYSSFCLNYTFDKTIRRVQDGLTNPDLQKFLVDRYQKVQILRAQRNSSDFQPEEFNLSIREVIQLTLIYQYYYKMQNDHKVTTGGSGSSYNYFHNRNYFTLRSIFLDIAQSVGDFSHQNCENIMNKWITVYIPFVIIIVLLYLAEWVLLAGYYNRVERILGWFTNPSNQVKLLEDIDSLEGFIKVLQNDQQLVYQYRFDLEKNENILKKRIPMVKIQKQVGKTKTLQPGKYLNISLPLIIAIGLFVAYSTIVTTQMRDHTEKYNQTIDFYQLMTDASVAIPAMFNQREILYYFFVFTYLNDTDKLNYFKAIDANLELLDDFVEIIQMFDGKKILAESDFVVTFEKALKSSLCNYLNSVIINFKKRKYQMFRKLLVIRGLLPTLNGMINSIRYDKSSNNFTTRALYPINEIEGPFLASLAIDTLHSKLKGSMQNRTDQVHTLIQVLSIMFLIFELILLALVLQVVIHYYKHDFLLYRRSLMLLSPSVLYSDQLERFIRLVQSQDMT